MSLLQAFSKVYSSKLFRDEQKKCYVIVQHFNHEQRGRESEEDALFVQEMALKLGFPVYVEKMRDTFSPLPKKNFQNVARLWRKQKAVELCEVIKGELTDVSHFFIVTAHHARDHVESIVQHILRGCGSAGLIGIQEFNENRSFFRPFANIEYEDLSNYIRQRGVSFREDSSNLEDDYQRNYIRRHVLPHFKKIQKNYEKNFLKLSESILQERRDEPHWSCLQDDSRKSELVFSQPISGTRLANLLKLTMMNDVAQVSYNQVQNLRYELELALQRRIFFANVFNGHISTVQLPGEWKAKFLYHEHGVEMQLLKNSPN
ncbi:MAG: tRNA lysidine(34) synthetase TilS [Silvanigrellaceae bacterium]|nr:tRNA lysidine(34) synthetase TilS [Silvanigrellaceae bacterium]